MKGFALQELIRDLLTAHNVQKRMASRQLLRLSAEAKVASLTGGFHSSPWIMSSVAYSEALYLLAQAPVMMPKGLETFVCRFLFYGLLARSFVQTLKKHGCCMCRVLEVTLH